MRIVDHSDRSWEKIAKSDPYFGVLTSDRYRSGQLNADAMAEFFRTGEEQIAHAIATAESHLNCRVGSDRALDFGCGAGRLVIPMGRRFTDVVGVDISAAYRSLAKENCAKHSVQNVRLVASLDELSAEVGTFDLVHSHLVFLHIPVRRGLRIIQGLVELLTPGGVGALHVLYHRDIGAGRRALNTARKYFVPLHWVLNMMSARSPFEPMMQANDYPLNRVLLTLTSMGVAGVYLELTQVDEVHHAYLYFRRLPA